ncbi:hypothetical protein BJ508DRAFT_410506 [Ascobolus immersus RN42]|uniref:Monopolin complex subunit Csm1/Pcs1 C-terminal domain-containing protein n=1 Tax=Ascobolus immersus RN42 TaxID=1160509 RepID=A0A3N4IPW5_ASCIM|nr:hypothetical protein BJ508DRAFT_410506 [Ascobolus immersus RN42]
MPPKRKAAAGKISNYVEISDDELEEQAPKRKTSRKNAEPEEETRPTRGGRAKSPKAEPKSKSKAKKGGRGRKQQSESEEEDASDDQSEEFHDTIELQTAPQESTNKAKRTTKKSAPPPKEPKEPKETKETKEKPAPRGRGRPRKVPEPEPEPEPEAEAEAEEDEEMEDAQEQVVVEREIAETQYEEVVEEAEEEPEEEEEEEKAPAPKPTRKGRGKKEVVAPEPAKVIPESQYDDTLSEPPKPTPKETSRRTGNVKSPEQDSTSSDGVEVKQEVVKVKKENSELRQHLDELTGLRETEAEKQLAAYKKNSKARLEAADATIKALQASLKEHEGVLAQLRNMEKKINARDIRISELEEETTSMEKKLELQKQECTSLSRKLAARPVAPAVPAANAINAKGGKHGAVAPVLHCDPWVAEAKEDFYSDLTGLAILSVKKDKNDEGEPVKVYECLATGKAGTLHFKLLLLDETAESRAQANYDAEVQITYIPLLNMERDKAVIEQMPDYLQEEIQFARNSLPKFYSKIETILNPKP